MKEGRRIQRVLYLVSALILLAGLGSSVMIYRAAVADANGSSEYEVVGGFLYPAGGVNSKKYMHDLQLYGGKSAVLADEFMRWFDGLWQGTSLAYTIACIAVFTSVVTMLVAYTLRPSRISGGQSGKRPA